MRNAYKSLFEGREGKKTLRRTSRKLKDNIKMNFMEVECKDVALIRLSQDRA
jgi:hypothetical protein